MALHKDHNLFLVIDFAFPICQRTHSDQSESADVLDLNQMICLNKSHLLCKKNFRVEDIGVEPMTLCVQGRCSSQLS